ncbi:sensor histidine kinase [Nocardioides solisilvae]|uniref:sensor histidine kinase n=1 Tax=Nocardioides solisilvae TaxID=1542435 RepID=UPI000D74F858|nr:HAMP domain-containing sensor histidine kinase [Nocardioides solisilvae]
MNRLHYRRSLASRVALLTTMAVGVAIAFMAAGSFLTVRMQLQSNLDDSLLNRTRSAASTAVLAEMTAREAPSWMLGAADVRIVYVTADGRWFTADDEGPAFTLGDPEVEVAAGERAESLRSLRAEDGTRYRVAAVPAGRGGAALVLLQPTADVDRTVRGVGTVMAIFGGTGVLVAALAGWLVARNGLRPVRRLTAAMEKIARTQDLRPIRVEGDDEVARLARAFNEMVRAVSASRDRERRLVADAGHELRTPLTSLRTNLDLLSQAGDGLPADARAELLDDVRAQTEELSTLVGDLVELARDEPLSHVVTELDLADVVQRAVARVRRRSSATFDVEVEPWRVRGEAGALERAVTNLLDNAAKWSPADGTVTVRLADGVLTVDDEGPGIAEEDLPRVFDRFYRSDDARALPGSGLGLSIVRQAVERHSGAVRADHSPAGGARLVMWVPGAQVGT